MAILEEDDPLWKRILLNELVLAFLAGMVILYVAFTFATGRKPEEEPKKKQSQRAPPPPAAQASLRP